MRFDSASSVEEVVWDMRISEEPRAADRALILKQFNGAPPFAEAEAEENNIQVNVNDLEGVNILATARQQWNNAHLKPSRFFTARADFGPSYKRSEWSDVATRHANRLLKADRRMVGLVRGGGANTLLSGIGPSNFKNRSAVIPQTVPVGSVLIPSETEIDDFDNLTYFAVFREWTPSQLYEMTHGNRVDPGWNLDLVKSQMAYLADQLRKSPNALAYQYMPERIEELIKQDKGYFGSDAVPTCDVWDFYFRENDDDGGWYRRVILDWGTGEESDYLKPFVNSKNQPPSKNRVGEDTSFLYSSREKRYAQQLDEIIHFQFGDCSAYAPFKYHSIRSLGWMLWGVCDLQNRLHCKFNEAVFEQMMWFFQTASNQDLIRLKKANFEHMGIIPQGIRFLTPNERYVPNSQLTGMAFERNRMLMNQSSTSYTQDYAQNEGRQPRTATETMALVNSANALASGIFELSYTYYEFLYREQFRRMCLKHNNDPIAKKFRARCLMDGIPDNMLDPEYWEIKSERVVGGGNKTVQMATVRYLTEIRKNLPPDGQRIVDHLSVEAALDQPDLAEEIAPLGKDRPISNSTHDAQLSTERLMRNLPFKLPKDAIAMDYITSWLHDLALLVDKATQAGGMVKPEDLMGMQNMAKHIEDQLAIEAKNPDQKPALAQYEENLSALNNHIKAFAQRLIQMMKAQQKQAGNGAGGAQAQMIAKVQAQKVLAEAKAANMRESHAQRASQKQQGFEAEQQRKNAELQADLQREGARARHELLANRLTALVE